VAAAERVLSRRFVAGTWKHDGERIRLDPFEKLDRTTRQELDDEAERLAEFHV
jgi:hypothetical protein